MRRSAWFRDPRARSSVLGAFGLLLCGAAIPALAQEPIERLGGVQEEVVVERIVIDAHVIGPDGNPIPGLTPDDFRVQVDGRPVILEAVDWLPAEEPENDASALVGIEGEEAQRFRQDAPPGRLVVLFFQHDGSQTTRLHGLMRMAQQARRFLATLLPTDRIAVASHDSQLKLRQDFTDDRAKIEAAINSSIRTSAPPEPDPTSQPSIGRYLDRPAARKAATTDRAIEVLARALEPLPGGKSMVFFGWGLGATVGGVTGAVASESKDFNDMIYSLARARVNMFTLDVADADYHTLEEYLKQVSQITGGSYQKTHLFPALGMELVRRAISGRYVLVIVKPRGTRGDHTIDVELVGKKGYVYARQYYQD
jgi:VWFA-related protein